MTVIKLLWANIKMTLRDKQAIFWSLVFPLMFIIIFGLFDFERAGDSKYMVFDRAQSELSKQFLAGFESVEIFKKIDSPGDLTSAREQLQKGDVDFILVIPEDFRISSAPGAESAKPGEIQVLYSQSANMTANQVALSVIDKFMDKMNLSYAQAPTIFSYSAETIQTKKIKYIDLIMPGILGMSIMTSAVIGISTGISRYREQKLLKRLSATPLKVRDFLAAEVLSYLCVNLVQVSLIILLARFAFQVTVYGNYFYLYAICLFGSIIFLNLGFAVAGYAKNTKTAEALSQVVTMPMMFFSGVFFSTETLPGIVAKIVEYLPLTPMIDALRAVSIDAAVIQDVWKELAFMAGWIVLSFLIAWRSFKFKN